MRDRTERWSLALVLFLAVGILAPIVFRSCRAEASENRSTDEAAAFLSDYLRIYPKRLKKAMALLPALEKAALAGRFDTLTMAVHVSLESSWRTDVTGAHGEMGLTQIMPGGVCASGHDLSDPEAQLMAGALCLSKCYDLCGDYLPGFTDERMKRTWTCYVTGKCRANARIERQMAYRVTVLKRAWEKYTGE